METKPASETLFNIRTFQTTRYEEVKILNGFNYKHTLAGLSD